MGLIPPCSAAISAPEGALTESVSPWRGHSRETDSVSLRFRDQDWSWEGEIGYFGTLRGYPADGSGNLFPPDRATGGKRIP